MFARDKSLQPSLMFAGKAGTYLIEAPERALAPYPHKLD